MKLTPEQKEQVTMLVIECATLAACVAFVLGYLAHMFVNHPQKLSCEQQEAIKKQSFSSKVYKLNEEWCAKNQKACRLCGLHIIQMQPEKNAGETPKYAAIKWNE